MSVQDHCGISSLAIAGSGIPRWPAGPPPSWTLPAPGCFLSQGRPAGWLGVTREGGYKCRRRLERRGSIHYADRDISTPAAGSNLAREIVAEELTTYAAEQFVTLYLNTKNHPVGYGVISIGTLNATLVHPREILKGALLPNAHAFIVAHNHSSGDDPAPSREDREVTERLKQAGSVRGIDLLDDLVIGHDGRCSSFRERGQL